ncbi:MAG: hypothetical protein EBZ50_03330 [Alphaproteobacteria bacterium]|nr:hypothetical protein [Alphaproteobacteria bacterium]
MTRPLVLAHPGLGGFEALFGQTYEIVRLPADPATLQARAAVVVGSIGLPRDALERAPHLQRLRGRKLGIVGLGAIGAAFATRAAALGLDVRWTGPRPKPDAPYPFEPDLAALAAWADVLAVCAPGGAATDKLIDAGVIAALGPDGMLINVARGSLVDEDALIDALKAGRLGSAGLDVFATEPTPPARWADVPNVTLTPHLGGATREAIMESAQLVLENLRRFFAGDPLATPAP